MNWPCWDTLVSTLAPLYSLTTGRFLFFLMGSSGHLWHLSAHSGVASQLPYLGHGASDLSWQLAWAGLGTQCLSLWSHLCTFNFSQPLFMLSFPCSHCDLARKVEQELVKGKQAWRLKSPHSTKPSFPIPRPMPRTVIPASLPCLPPSQLPSFPGKVGCRLLLRGGSKQPKSLLSSASEDSSCCH
jgi:hypothetical protein